MPKNVKPWQKALDDIRSLSPLLGPTEPKFRRDTTILWEYIKSLENQIEDFSTPKKNEPIKIEIQSRNDLGTIINENCFSTINKGFKFSVTDNDRIPFSLGNKGSMATIPKTYSPPGVPERWQFDLCFPTKGNINQFPNGELGVLWSWEHVRNNSVNPVGYGCHLAIDGRNEAGSNGLHFKVPAPIRDGKRVNDFEYLHFPTLTAPTVHFDHNYHIEIEVLHSGGNEGYFRASIDGHLVVDHNGPNLPTEPDGQDPYLIFGYISLCEKDNTVEFTNIVRTK